VAGSGSDDVHVYGAFGLYLLGALKGDEQDRVERHLARCADCCVEADALRAAVELLVMAPPQDVRDLLAELEAPGHGPDKGCRPDLGQS
jgi:anti-sigma factor RsiW